VRPAPSSNDPHGERLAKLVELCQQISLADDPAGIVDRFIRLYHRIRRSDHFISLSTRGLEPGWYKVTRQFDEASMDEDHVDVPDPWSDWDSIPAHRGGFLGDVIADDRPRLFSGLRVDDDPVLGGAISGMGSCIARPIYDRGRAVYWALNFRRSPHGFDADDLADGLLIANLVGTSVSSMLIARENRRLADAVRAQLEQVARVQQSLLPRRLPSIPGVSIATSYLPSDEAGGDYYDFFAWPEGKWGILIADVSGHGAAAATVMAMLHAILHAYEGPAFAPASILAYANRRLLAAQIDHIFVTAFLGEYDPRTGQLTYALAGHHPPRIKTARDGRVSQVQGPASPPIGLFDDYRIEQETVTIRPGDTLVLFTDGIVEAFGPGRRMFGVEGVDAVLDRCSGEPDCVIESVHGALYEHTGVRTRDDDQVLIVLRRTEGGDP